MDEIRRGFLEIKPALKHPDQAHVKDLVEKLLRESRRKVAAWHVEMMEYDFYSSVYQARLMLDGNSAVAKIPTEWIDDVWKDGSKFKRKKIKRALKRAVEAFYELEDE